uniref:Uncharacterized protein n=1 Tax=Triticum urartu TaxID=4572 RepID=A0A8R7PYX4_TRIUA
RPAPPSCGRRPAPPPGCVCLRRAPPPGYEAAALILLPAPLGAPSTSPAASSSYLLPAMSAAPSTRPSVPLLLVPYAEPGRTCSPGPLRRRSPAPYASLRQKPIVARRSRSWPSRRCCRRSC